MRARLNHLRKLLFDRNNYGVTAPSLFTEYEVKLLAAIALLALVLIWALARNRVQEGVLGLALVGGLAVYLSYVKYYCTYKPAMDRWGIRELACSQHPRKEFRVASRDLLISQDEVKFIARQYGVKIVCHISPDNPSVQIYELEKSYQHRILANQFKAEGQFPRKRH